MLHLNSPYFTSSASGGTYRSNFDASKVKTYFMNSYGNVDNVIHGNVKWDFEGKINSMVHTGDTTKDII